MKRFLLVLGMTACLFGLTACGADAEYLTTEEVAIEKANEHLSELEELAARIESEGVSVYDEMNEEAPALKSTLESWSSAKEEFGGVPAINDAKPAEVSSMDKFEAVVKIYLVGDNGKTGELEVMLEKYGYADDTLYITSATANVDRSFSEKMENAALNTLLGMGTVFAVLILISGLISCFKYINVVQNKLSKKEEKAAAPAPVVAAPVEAYEEEDDLELIAVIAAAIAASEGAASTDGYVVRSIKRRSGKWQKA